MPNFANHANLSEQQALQLVAQVRPLEQLQEVLDWGRSQSTPRPILEVVVHDDTCHDVVMEWQAGLHLVFDTDCLGQVRKVSVWDFRPLAGDLTEMREVEGWSVASTESDTLGHQACLVTRAADAR